MRNKGVTALAILASVVAPGLTPVSADLVQISFTAELRTGAGGLDAPTVLGSTATGSWTFDTTATGSGANPNVFPLTSFEFLTDAGASGGATVGTISIANNLPSQDEYFIAGAGVFGTAGDPGSVRTLSDLSILLIDDEGSVFSNTSLPTAFDLPAFELAELSLEWLLPAAEGRDAMTFFPIYDLVASESRIAPAPGVVPAPGAALLAMLGLPGAVWIRRRFSL